MIVDEAACFCEQKDGAAPHGAKKLFESVAWVVAGVLPRHRTRFKKSFWVPFFKKELLVSAFVTSR
jgi:uncharacterized membrane protein